MLNSFHTLSTLLAFSGVVQSVVTTGVLGNGVRARQEIRSFAANKDAWNVYLLAVSAMADVPQSNVQSYYEIAKIHGLPAGEYDGVAGVENPNNFPGYCTHASVYFGTWHRAYVALFEQELQKNALAEVDKFPPGAVKTRYLTAAANLRTPYLDWTQPGPGNTAFPSLLTDSTVKVTRAVNNKVVTSTIPNPLLRYKFHPGSGDLGSYFNETLTTLRSPNNNNAKEAVSQEGLSRSALDADRPALHDRLYKLLTRYATYDTFGNELWIENSNVDEQDSIESVHDAVHSDIGGGKGHMTYLEVAAFDPVFFLHHAMIDRCFAIWQALHPWAYFEPQTQNQGNFWYNAGIVARSTDALKPFHKNDAGDFWNSDEVRDWTIYGYTYPELSHGYTEASVRAAIDKLYSASEDPGLITSSPPETSSRIKRQISAVRAEAYDYYINIRVDKHALLRPYVIYAFLGEVGDDPSEWLKGNNFVGMQAIAARVLSEQQKAALKPVLITASISLTRALHGKIATGELNATNSDAINAYLKKNLSWKVLINNGTVYEAAQVPELLVSVGSTTYQSNSSAGVIGIGTTGFSNLLNKASSVIAEITEGKGGGLASHQVGIYKSN